MFDVEERYGGEVVRQRSVRCLRSVCDVGRGRWWCLVADDAVIVTVVKGIDGGECSDGGGGVVREQPLA